jgi:hypothetical protein
MEPKDEVHLDVFACKTGATGVFVQRVLWVRSKGGKMFFFEKKNQKTFVCGVGGALDLSVQ